MTIFTRRKNSTGALGRDGSTTENLTQKIPSKKSSAENSKNKNRIRGNIFFALFAAVAMVGTVGYGFNTVIKGPLTSMSDVTRRTVTENYVITASRVAIVNATTQQANSGDCDADGMIEPLPYRAPAGAPAPTGGGLIPLDLVPDTTDPWNTQYGYCAWDAGSSSVSDAVVGCGGATPRRLEGSPNNNRYSIAIISAGKDKKFNTTCNAYVNDSTNLLVKTDGSDDIVLAYTYAEANDLGNGLWKEKVADPTTLQTDKSVESTGGATFSDKVVLTGNTATGGGLVLPGDPGDDSLSGPCNSVNEKQLRRNTSTSPPTLEICDYNGGAGLGWTPVSGSGTSTPSGPADCTGLGAAHYNDAASGHCYFYVNVTRSYDDSQAHCVANGGYLMVPSTLAENNIIADELGVTWVRIGITDAAVEGDWEYAFGELAGTQFWSGDETGSPVGGQFNAWESPTFSKTEPNGGAGENCAVATDYYSWYDVSCPATIEFVCEVPGTPSGGGGSGSGAADCTGLGDDFVNDPTTGHCYFQDSAGSDYPGTNAVCTGIDPAAYIVSITSADENTLIGAQGWDWGWIGASDDPSAGTTEGNFVYTSGELAGTQFWTGGLGGSAVGGQFSNWESGHPDNFFGDSDCVVTVNSGEWHVHGCSQIQPVICEKSAAGATPVNPTPVARWRLDESSGTTVTDSIGGHNGTLIGTATWQPTGGANRGALSFTAGNNAYIRIPRAAALEPSAVTVSLWMLPAATQSDWAGLFTKTWNNNSGPTNHSYGLYYNASSDTKLRAHIGRTGGVNFINMAGNIATAWTHVALTYDPNSSNLFNFYINGVLDSSSALLDPIVYDTANSGDIYIGSTQSANGERFTGLIDDVRVYNKALTADQIMAIVTATSPPPPSLKMTNRPGELVGWGLDTEQTQGNGASSLNTSSPYFLPNGEDFVQVSSGRYHGCGVKKDGTVWCWGDGDSYKLGNGSTTDQGTMVQVPGLADFVKVVAGGSHSCALKNNGSVWCWGEGSSGELGNGTSTDSLVPVQVSGVNDYTDIAATEGTSCGLTYSGAVNCWGMGAQGQLGNGGSGTAASPNPVINITNFTQISGAERTLGANEGHFCGVTKAGTAYCWGREAGGEFGNTSGASGNQNVPTQFGTRTDLAKISTSGTLTCAITASGSAYCSGSDSVGQLGNGAVTTGTQHDPLIVSDVTDFIDIEAGVDAACGIRKGREVVCWGNDANGELGNGPGVTANQTTPVKTNIRNAIAISIGDLSHTAIIDNSATDAVVADKNLNLIAAGRESGCTIIKDGGAACWGDDTNGELGNGTITGTQYTPTAVNDAGPWMQISNSVGSTAFGHACGIKGDGSAWCWGYGGDGQLGNGTSTQTSPVVVDVATRKWSQVSVGAGYACGLEPDGEMYCWGVGFGATPTQAQAGKVWTKISAGRGNTCGITKDGRAWCWGEDALGQLGNGATTTTTQTTAVEISGDGPWVDISAGDVSCGIKSNGTLWCWGDLTSAAITGWDNTVPQLMMDIGPWVKVKSARRNVCAIKANGTLWCFGEGSDYMNGNNSTTDYAYPQLVFGGGQYIDVSVGYDQVCAMKSDYTAYCWGLNGTGQIGNASQQGATAQRPVRVELTPQRAGWEWNSTDTAIKPATGLSPIIGTSRWISDDGAANKGLNLGTSGRAQLRQSTANQLLVETKGAGHDAQATLRAPSATIGSNITAGLIRHFKLDETTGATIVDTIGGGNGTWSDGSGNVVVQETVPGINGTALQFDGTDDRISISNFTPATEGTVSAWVKFDDVNENRFIGGHDDFEIMLYGSSGWIESDIGGSAGPVMTSPVANTWYFVAVNWTAIESSLYINGSLVAVEPGPTIPTGPFTLYIGGSVSGDNMDGTIDDVRIYDRALDPGEVSQLYYFTQNAVITRSIGLDATTGNFEISRNNTAASGWLSSLPPDIEIDETGNVGIGTSGAPASKLDVNGAIKIGNEVSCGGSSEGTIRWTGTTMEYCDGGSWTPLTSVNTVGGGGTGSGYSLWQSYSKGPAMIKGGGTAWTFGSAGYGRLGNGQDMTDAYSSVPVEVWNDSTSDGWEDWIDLRTTLLTSCGVRANGEGWCWGSGLDGNIGGGDLVDSSVPLPVVNTADTGFYYDWKMINPGLSSVCGVRAMGTAYCWGAAIYGTLGNNTTTGVYDTPNPVHSDANPWTPWTDWKFVETEISAAVGLRANGGAYSWGYNEYGLGFAAASATFQPRPQLVKGAGGIAGYTDWKDLAAGWENICGIRGNGQMYCWGKGAEGALATGNDSDANYPTRTLDTNCSSSSTNWVDVDISGYHGCAIKAGGTLWCWGRSQEGQTGNNDAGPSSGDSGAGFNYCMHQVLADDGGAGWTDWVSVSSDYYNTCGQRANGSVWCWGQGAAGDGYDSYLPVMVQTP